MADVGRAAYIRAIELPEGEDPGSKPWRPSTPPSSRGRTGRTSRSSRWTWRPVRCRSSTTSTSTTAGRSSTRRSSRGRSTAASRRGSARRSSRPSLRRRRPAAVRDLHGLRASDRGRAATAHDGAPGDPVAAHTGRDERGRRGRGDRLTGRRGGGHRGRAPPYDARITETPVTPAAILELVRQRAARYEAAAVRVRRAGVDPGGARPARAPRTRRRSWREGKAWFRCSTCAGPAKRAGGPQPRPGARRDRSRETGGSASARWCASGGSRQPIVRERLPLMGEAAHHIATPPIRTRGTVGGSVAHADPAAELPATIAALEGRLLAARRGTGAPAGDFFLGRSHGHRAR